MLSQFPTYYFTKIREERNIREIPSYSRRKQFPTILFPKRGTFPIFLILNVHLSIPVHPDEY